MTKRAFNLLLKEAVWLTLISAAIFLIILLLTPGPAKHWLVENSILIAISSLTCFFAFGFYVSALYLMKNRSWVVIFLAGLAISIILFSIATISFEVVVSEIMMRNLELNIIPHVRSQHFAAVMQIVSLCALIRACWKGKVKTKSAF